MQSINVKEAEIRTLKADDIDYVCITDIARQKILYRKLLEYFLL